MSVPSPSKWSEILSVISSSASKPYQTQASRHTCGTELHMSSSKAFQMVRDTVRYKQLCIKTMPKHELQEIHGSRTLKFPGCTSFKILDKNFAFWCLFSGLRRGDPRGDPRASL